MNRRSKFLVVLGTGIVTMLALALSDSANAQRKWRPNMYDRYGGSQRTYNQPYNYGYRVQPGQTTQSLSVEPIDFKAGDNVKVTVDTPLKRGNDVLANVPAGENHKILKVIGPWVGIAVDQDGEEVRGWVTFRALEAAQ